MPIRITGMNSGLDTESIIKAMTEAYSTKKNKYVKAQTKLTWKQDAWKTLNTKIYSLYTSVGSLRTSNAYNLKKSTVSDSTKATVTASNNAVSGTQTLEVNSLAKAGYLTGGKLAGADGSKVSGSTKLSELGYTGDEGTISLTVEGKTKDISVTKDSTINEVVTALKEAGVNANFDEANQRIFVSAQKTGKDNDFSLNGSNQNGINILNTLGLAVDSTANTDRYTEMAGKAIQDASGNYDSSATYTSILDELKEMRAKAQENYNLAVDNDAHTQNNTENKWKEKAEYTAAKDAVNDAKTTDAELVELMGLSTEDKEKYVALNDDGTLKRDGDGKLIYLEESSTEAKQKVSDRIENRATAAGLIDGDDKTKLNELQANINKVVAIDDNESLTADDKLAYYDTTAASKYQANVDAISANNVTIAANNQYISDSYWNQTDVSTMDDTQLQNLASSYTAQVTTAVGVTNGSISITSNPTASRVNGQDAQITLNNAVFTSTTNSFSINGLNITATSVTAPGESVSITTDTDNQGIYDKVKDFLSQYNSLMKEISSLYNADSAKGYEPLTDDEKEAMSDSEVEKWEKKIKDSLLRRDSSLGSLMTAMSSAMAKTYEINGKKYSFSSFGISTLGILNSACNEQYAYHINGDSEDSATSGNADKLMAAINTDPDTVVDFLKQAVSGLYDAIDAKMKSSSVKSIYTVYNDKEMASEYSNYSELISKWEDKVTDLEDSYYKKFAAMEKALATLQSSTQSLTGIMGS